MSFVESFWKFTQGMAVILPGSMHNCRIIWQLYNRLWANTFSQDLSWIWVSNGYDILQHDCVDQFKFWVLFLNRFHHAVCGMILVRTILTGHFPRVNIVHTHNMTWYSFLQEVIYAITIAHSIYCSINYEPLGVTLRELCNKYFDSWRVITD